MRYTTIIDISEFPAIYRNPSVRLLYLHLCLRSGYHDHDRDVYGLSIRATMAETGLSMASVRHALNVLEKYHFIRRVPGVGLYVRKWIENPSISPRKSKKQDVRQYEELKVEELKRTQEQQRAKLPEGKTSFMVYYESMQERAAAGDAAAIEVVEKNRKTYERHAAAQQKKKAV